jgi:hypothetical protein
MKNDTNQAYYSKTDVYHLVNEILNGSVDPIFKALPDYACLANNAYIEKNKTTDRRYYPIDGWEKSTLAFSDVLVEYYGKTPYLKGLAVEAFISKQNDKNVVALVFRGTRLWNFSDWIANLNWFSRKVQSRDNHYQQVKKCIGLYVNEIQSALSPNHLSSKNLSSTVFVGIGHSLGGGLAQQAAYASPEIQSVFAFNSSPVTGFFTTEKKWRQQNSKHLTIYRIEEEGDILSFIRFWGGMAIRLKQDKKIYPQRHILRFNFKNQENAIKQHSMEALALSLLKYKPKYNRTEML